MSDTSSFHAVLDRIEEEVGIFSIEPTGKIEIPVEYLPSEIEEGCRLFIQVAIDAEGTQYLEEESGKAIEEVEESTEAYEYMDDVA